MSPFRTGENIEQMEIVVVAIGSAGDVHPFMGIAIQLQQRGHAVTVLANASFEQDVRSAGLRFHPVGDPDAYGRAVDDPVLWDAKKGVQVLWRGVCEPAVRPTYEFILRKAASTTCVVLASPMAFGARLAHETLGVRLITGYLAPQNIRTCHGALRIAGATIPAWVPQWCRRMLWRQIDLRILDPLVCPSLNEYRQELGLDPVHRVFNDWYHKTDLSITLFPEWFAARQPDWPENLKAGNFPLFDTASTDELPAELEAFLGRGERPVVFMPGSAMRHAQDFFQTSMEACAELGYRAIFLTQFREQIPAILPPSVRHFAYVPFSQLLRRTAGLVHHGGIGTCAQALRAGVPQLIMPMAYDQFDNAARAKMLGVSDTVSPSSYKNPLVSRRLHALLNSESVREKCQEVAQRFGAANTTDEVCQFVEALA